MSAKIVAIRHLSETFRSMWLLRNMTYCRGYKVSLYSTAIHKGYIDILDLFTDILIFNRERSELQRKVDIEPLTKGFRLINSAEELCQGINFTDKIAAKKTLDEILQKNIANQNWNNVTRIMNVYMNENIAMNFDNIQSLVAIFSNSGFLKGFLQLRVILCTSQPDVYLKMGELLTQLATCYWIAGNSKECFFRLNEFFTNYPSLKESCKMSLKKIIYEAVANRSEAELKCTVAFIEKYTNENNDFYYVAVLWNYLFLSEWFTDHNLADELLCRHKELQSIISLMASSLSRYLLKTNRINDVYRLMQVFLKHEMMDSYTVVSQILFDYCCRKGNQDICSEIVKTSVKLKAPLREEQYNYFISWCATGDLFKHSSVAEIKRNYSNY